MAKEDRRFERWGQQDEIKRTRYLDERLKRAQILEEAIVEFGGRLETEVVYINRGKHRHDRQTQYIDEHFLYIAGKFIQSNIELTEAEKERYKNLIEESQENGVLT